MEQGFVDLHAHTHCSDGSLSPAELVDLALSKNLTALAITDHDTTAGVAEALEHAVDSPLEVIPGVELSTEYLGRDIHLIGLYVDHTDPEFIRLNAEVVAERDSRARAMCRLLTEHGMPVDYEELLAYSFPDPSRVPILTRGHFGRFLLHKGYVETIAEAFDKHIGEDCPCYLPWKRITPEEGIARIRKYHGIPILAHPLKYKLPKEELKKLIARLSAAGLAGIEVWYPTHTEEETAYVLSLAKEFALLPSGASDFHGANKPGLELGTGYDNNLAVPGSILTAIKHRHFGTTEKTKVFFSDFDGTLSTSHKDIGPGTQEALYAWTKAGHRLAVSSGRPLSNLLSIYREKLSQYPGSYLLGSDGAEIYECDTERLLYFEGIPFAIASEIISLARDLGIYVHAYSHDGICAEKMTPELEYYLGWVPLPVSYLGDRLQDSLPVPPPKILGISLDGQEKLFPFRDAIKERYKDRLTVVFSSEKYMEIVSSRVNKGKGLLWLSRHLGVDVANTVSAGDAENDIFMLRAAGLGIAMQNGLALFPEIKEAADVVTATDNDHDGLAPILMQNL